MIVVSTSIFFMCIDFFLPIMVTHNTYTTSLIFEHYEDIILKVNWF